MNMYLVNDALMSPSPTRRERLEKERTKNPQQINILTKTMDLFEESS